ncbi:MAG: carbon-nitrogen hydrolase family protein [Rhodovibrionaceae bacterium]
MTTFSIAAVQLVLEPKNNVEAICRMVARVKARFPWVDMILFGELAPHGYSTLNAEELPSPTEARFQETAAKHGVWLLPGSLFIRENGQIFNSAPVIDRSGEIVGRYRKMFPFYPYEAGVAPGQEFLVFDVPEVGRLGVSICYDMWFPETSRTLAWMGAEVILHPTLTNSIDRDVERTMVRATAVQNQCYVVDVNNAGGAMGVGRSGLVGPEGDVIYEAGSGEEVLAYELDLARVRRVRERGIFGLGQVLKSFRDSPVSFPPYTQGHASPSLQALGPLQLQQSASADVPGETEAPPQIAAVSAE